MHIFVDVDDRMMWTAAGDFSLHICNIVVLVIKAPLPSIRKCFTVNGSSQKKRHGYSSTKADGRLCTAGQVCSASVGPVWDVNISAQLLLAINFVSAHTPVDLQLTKCAYSQTTSLRIHTFDCESRVTLLCSNTGSDIYLTHP